jgi:UDP-glucose 4-epimerase
MKLASEAVIRSAFQRYLDKVLIFRFPNVIGFPATHGVIKDFITRLQINPNELVVLGNGEQNKPYLHVTDLIGAMLHLHEYYSSGEILEVINLGSPHENVFVKTIAEAVCSRVSPSAQIIFGSTEYGWVGDMPQVKFEIQKLISTGWKCKLSGLPAVQLTIDQILDGRENDCIPNPA